MRSSTSDRGEPGDAAAGLPGTRLGRRLRRRRQRVLDIAARYGVTNVRVFGSVARSDDTGTSDVDLLVDVPPHLTLFGLAGLGRELSEELGVRVDVVPAGDLKEHLRDVALREAVPL